MVTPPFKKVRDYESNLDQYTYIHSSVTDSGRVEPPGEGHSRIQKPLRDYLMSCETQVQKIEGHQNIYGDPQAFDEMGNSAHNGYARDWNYIPPWPKWKSENSELLYTNACFMQHINIRPVKIPPGINLLFGTTAGLDTQGKEWRIQIPPGINLLFGTTVGTDTQDKDLQLAENKKKCQTNHQGANSHAGIISQTQPIWQTET